MRSHETQRPRSDEIQCPRCHEITHQVTRTPLPDEATRHRRAAVLETKIEEHEVQVDVTQIEVTDGARHDSQLPPVDRVEHSTKTDVNDLVVLNQSDANRARGRIHDGQTWVGGLGQKLPPDVSKEVPNSRPREIFHEVGSDELSSLELLSSK